MTRTMLLALALMATTPAFAGDSRGPNGDDRHNDAASHEGQEADTAGKLMNDIKRQEQLDFWNDVISTWGSGPRNEAGSSCCSGSSYGGNQAERAGF